VLSNPELAEVSAISLTISMSERAINLFLYVQKDVIHELGLAAHELDGSDDQILGALRSRVDADFARAARYPIPTASIKASLGIDASRGLPLEAYWYLARTGNPLHIFEDALKAIGAPARPLFCTTVIANGKPQTNDMVRADSASPQVLHSKQFGGLVSRVDYLSAYLTAAGLDVDALLGDDFIEAIKLLYEHKHYVSAMKLLVSFIDSAAYLDLGDRQGNFAAWLSKYANLTPVGITPGELWEFRNSLLDMTNPQSRKVLAGQVPPLSFQFDRASQQVRVDGGTGTKMFSFEALYNAVIEAIGPWTKAYSGNLAKQLEFIKRYDTILSEGLIGKLRDNRRAT
jgi:hypothetical protein